MFLQWKSSSFSIQTVSKRTICCSFLVFHATQSSFIRSLHSTRSLDWSGPTWGLSVSAATRPHVSPDGFQLNRQLTADGGRSFMSGGGVSALTDHTPRQWNSTQESMSGCQRRRVSVECFPSSSWWESSDIYWHQLHLTCIWRVQFLEMFTDGSTKELKTRSGVKLLEAERPLRTTVFHHGQQTPNDDLLISRSVFQTQIQVEDGLFGHVERGDIW